MTDVDIESVFAIHRQERLQVGLSDTHGTAEAMDYESAIADPPPNGARADGESIRDLDDGKEALN